MNALRRVMSFGSGLLMLLGCYLMLRYPDYGYRAVILLLDAALLLAGVRLLIYYFSMARFMVDGLDILYKSLILLDAGQFMFGMNELPQTLAMLYLIGCLAVSGGVRLLRAFEAKGIGARSWRSAFLAALFRLGLAVASLFFLDSVWMLTVLYSFGLAQSALSRMASALRRTAIVYVGAAE